jgi:hypothetical protein
VLHLCLCRHTRTSHMRTTRRCGNGMRGGGGSAVVECAAAMRTQPPPRAAPRGNTPCAAVWRRLLGTAPGSGTAAPPLLRCRRAWARHRWRPRPAAAAAAGAAFATTGVGGNASAQPSMANTRRCRCKRQHHAARGTRKTRLWRPHNPGPAHLAGRGGHVAGGLPALSSAGPPGQACGRLGEARAARFALRQHCAQQRPPASADQTAGEPCAGCKRRTWGGSRRLGTPADCLTREAPPVAAQARCRVSSSRKKRSSSSGHRMTAAGIALAWWLARAGRPWGVPGAFSVHMSCANG